MMSKNKIENIEKIIISKRKSIGFILKKNQEYILFFKESKISLPKPPSKLIELDENLIIVLNNGISYKWDIIGGTLQLFDFQVLSYINDFLIFVRGYGLNKIYGKFDLIRNSVVFETKNIIGQYYSNSSTFLIYNDIIISRSLNDGKILWEIVLGKLNLNEELDKLEKLTINNYLGIINGILILQLNYRFIIGINEKSGENSFIYKYNDDEVSIGSNFHLVDYKICSIGKKNYLEINLSDLRETYYDIEDQVLNHKVIPARIGNVDDDFIPFWESNNNHRFGLFDRHKKEIVLSDEIVEAKGMFPAIIDMKYSNGELYVLDRLKTLHIYNI